MARLRARGTGRMKKGAEFKEFFEGEELFALMTDMGSHTLATGMPAMATIIGADQWGIKARAEGGIMAKISKEHAGPRSELTDLFVKFEQQRYKANNPNGPPPGAPLPPDGRELAAQFGQQYEQADTGGVDSGMMDTIILIKDLQD